MSDNWEKFMLESNRIEGEDRLNSGDEDVFNFVCGAGIETLEDILYSHQLLGRYLEVDWVGKWRDCNVVVGDHHPPDFRKIPSLMDKYMLEFTSLSSWEAHNQFELIHPFQDLNGRVGRLIWLSKAVDEGYDFSIPFLQKYYYQTLNSQE